MSIFQADLFAPAVPPAPARDAALAERDRQRERLREIHRRLCKEYGCPVAHWAEHDPLSALVSALLSHRTRNKESGAAFDELRRCFPTWEQVRDAPAGEVQATIAACNWPEQKAPRIQDVLRRITARRGGDLSLDFLAGMEARAARDWLEEMPGVGPKSSAAVLSFSNLRMRALPVDSHHHRVAQRLGLIPESLDVGPAHAVLEAMLPEEWDAQEVYDDHEVLMFHGQRCCFHRAPECDRCVLRDLCPVGQTRLKGLRAPPSATAHPAVADATGAERAKKSRR